MNYRKYFVLILTILSILFASCSNFFEDSVSKEQSASNSSAYSSTENPENANETVKYISVTGSINLEGAYPQEILNQVQNISSSNRTAFPTAPALSGLTLSVRAVNTSNSADTINGEIISETNNGSYRINIPVSSPAKEYEIHITASQTWGEVLSGKSEAFTISQSSPVTEKNITLKAIQSEGVGTFNLRIGISTNVGDNIQSGVVTYHPTPQTVSSYPFSKSSNICTIKKGTIGTDEITNGLACGSYLMTFDFYSGPVVNSAVTGNLVYSFKQTVNIFKGLETNTWVKNGSEPYLTTSGNTTTCMITKDLIDSFALTDLYVKAGASESGTGSFLSPLPSISKAIEKMYNKDLDYIIHVDGEVSGMHEIPNTLKSDGTGTYNAKSVTICGKTGLDANGLPQDCLNGNYTVNNVLLIATAVPVHIKDLQITGGNSKGLMCENGSNVVTYSGVLIGKNMTETPSETNCGNKGYGIENSGNLVIQGSKISGNYYYGILSGDYHVQPYLEVRDAIVTRNRLAGIYVSNGADDDLLSAKIIRTNITYNGINTIEGGGFYGEEGSSTEFYDCVISDNIAERGGGLYSFAKSVKLENCTVKDNSAVDGGAGIWVQETDELTLSGTTQFIDNIAESGAGAIHVACYLGPLYIGDDVYIPYGGEDGLNDIYISEADLTITSSLTKHSKWNPIQLRLLYYGEGDTVLTANDASVHLDVEKVKFDVKPQTLDNGGTKAWGIDNNGKLKSLIGEKSRPTALYDIVFNDGSATAYSSGLSLSGTETQAAIAVIYYIGTDCSNDGTTQRMLGVGLHQGQNLIWCTAGTSDNNMLANPAMSCWLWGGPGTWSPQSNADRNGSDNLAQHGEYLAAQGRNDTTSDSTQYPAFYFAINYKNVSSNIIGTEYEKGWYYPSMYELARIYWSADLSEVNAINAALGKCNGTQFHTSGDHHYGSASNDEDAYYCNYLVFHLDTMSCNDNDGWESWQRNTDPSIAIAIHEF